MNGNYKRGIAICDSPFTVYFRIISPLMDESFTF